MEFMNVGGGELLIIILLALVLFSPEDILKLMRTVGKYAQTARQMWSNVSKGLQDDYIPDEVRQVVKETASTVKEAQTTLSDVRKQFNDITTTVEEDVSEATQIADKEVTEAVNTINKVQDSELVEETDLESDAEDTVQDEEINIDTQISEISEILPEEPVTAEPETIDQNTPRSQDENKPQVDTIKQELTPLSSTAQNKIVEDVLFDNDVHIGKDAGDAAILIKADSSKSENIKGTGSTITVNAKLAKVAEDSLKDDGNDY